MSEKENNNENEELYPSFSEDEFNVKFEEAANSAQIVDELADGTQILRDAEEETVEDEKPELNEDDLKKLIEFTTGVKAANISENDIESLRNNEEELERLLRISIIKAKNFNYNPKKNFNAKYRQKRKIKNRMAKASRRCNRK